MKDLCTTMVTNKGTGKKESQGNYSAESHPIKVWDPDDCVHVRVRTRLFHGVSTRQRVTARSLFWHFKLCNFLKLVLYLFLAEMALPWG